MGRLDVIDADLLGWWLAERQLNSGGLNGRPEKLPDVCYRFETCGLKFKVLRDHSFKTSACLRGGGVENWPDL